MEDSKDFFATVCKSGQLYKYNSLEEMAQCPEDTVECYLHGKYTHTFKGPSNWTDWYHFSIIDKHGQDTTYRVGNYEVVLIGEDSGYTNFFGRQITINSLISNQYYPYTSRLRYNSFIIDEIKPLLSSLNNCRSEDDIRQVLNARMDYNTLKLELDTLKSENRTLLAKLKENGLEEDGDMPSADSQGCVKDIQTAARNNELAFLLGNGVNLHYSGNNSIKWDSLIKSVADSNGYDFSKISGLLPTEQYSSMVLGFTEKDIKKKVIAKVWLLRNDHSKYNSINQKLRDYNCPVLTTNIDSALDSGQLHCIDNCSLILQSRLFELAHPSMETLNKYWGDIELTSSDKGYGVWHMHGHVEYPETIRFGLVDYGKLIARINALLGSKNEELMKTTWLYPFIYKKLCIVGLGLKHQEVFIRWLLLRKAHILKSNAIKLSPMGWYLYSAEEVIPPEISQFLHSVGISMVPFKNHDGIYNSLF